MTSVLLGMTVTSLGLMHLDGLFFPEETISCWLITLGTQNGRRDNKTNYAIHVASITSLIGT